MKITRVLVFALFAAFAPASFAAVFTVTNTTDSGPGSLRQAIIDSNSNNQDDTINFDPAVFNIARTILLTSGHLLIGPDNAGGTVRSLTINGTGADKLEINGNGNSRVFKVGASAKAIIDRVKIADGNGTDNGEVPEMNSFGGGILVDGQPIGVYYSLTLTNSIVSGNRVTINVGLGSGLLLHGRNLIVNCAIYGNVGTSLGAAVFVGGETHMINSTVTQNSAQDAGGIYVHFGKLYLTNSTVARNTATGLGANAPGILAVMFFPQDVGFFPRNSIVSNNLAPLGAARDVSGKVSSRGNNMFGISVGIEMFTPLINDFLDIDPMLSETMTTGANAIPSYTFSPGSLAVDSGNNCVLQSTANGGCSEVAVTTDFRGVTRPQDADGNGTATVDRGAFEITAAEVALSPGRPDLLTEDDAGQSNSDDITCVPSVSFEISGLTVGATVHLLQNNVPVSNVVATATTMTLNDTLTTSGIYHYTARQTIGTSVGLPGLSKTIIFDNIPPTGSITQEGSQRDPTAFQPIVFRLVVSEPIYHYNPLDFSLANSTANVSQASLAVNGVLPTLIVTINNILSSGNVVLTYRANEMYDIAGNPNPVPVSGPDNTVTFDTILPTVTINQAAGQADPARSLPINYTVVFSEPMTGFDRNDLSFTGSTAIVPINGVTVTGSGTTWNVAVGVLNSEGTVVATIPPNRISDPAGNPNTASTSTDNVVTFSSRSTPLDFDGDDKVDLAIFRPSVGEWWINRSSNNTTFAAQFGASTDEIAPGDYTGDGKTDIAFFRPSSNEWYILRSENSTFYSFPFGATGDVLAPADYDADGKTDAAVFRPSSATWFIQRSTDGQTQIQAFGQTGDLAVPADYDNDGKADIAIYRPSAGQWWLSRSTAGVIALSFGGATDRPVQGDYTGDGKADTAFWRPSTGEWFVLRSNDFSYYSQPFGASTDIPSPGDYDGDGKHDPAVFRPSDSTWYIARSTAGTLIRQFGASGDIPVPNAYVP